MTSTLTTTRGSVWGVYLWWWNSLSMSGDLLFSFKIYCLFVFGIINKQVLNKKAFGSFFFLNVYYLVIFMLFFLERSYFHVKCV